MTNDVPAPCPAAAPESDSALMPDWFRNIVFAAIIVFAGLFVAAPAFHGTWLWEDDQEVSANFAVQDASGKGLATIWKGAVGSAYVPVKSSILWAEWKIFTLIGLRHDATFGTPGAISPDYQGDINAGYHVVNALFHVINALLVWVLFRRLKIKWAWIGGLLFATHPVLVESVAWITGQRNTLALLFMLLSMICFINFDERRKTKDVILSLILFIAAALSYSSVVMLPPCLLLYAWWKRGRLAARDFAYAAPFFLVSVIVSLVTVYYQNVMAIGAEIIPVGDMVSRTATAGMAVWFYLWKIIWPVGLLPIYPRWEVTHPAFAQLAVPWLAMLVVFAACVLHRKTWGRHVILGLGFFLGNLVPVLGFVTMSYMRITWVADHFVYISIIGVLGLAVAGVAALHEKIPANARNSPWTIGAGIAALGALVLALVANAHSHAGKFLNETVMWEYTLSKNPDAWQAHSRLGKVLLDHGRTDDSFFHIQQSVLLRPDLAETNNNMGVLLIQKKRGPEAIPYFRRSVRLMPIGAFLFNYANALTTQGRGAEAVPAYEKLLRMNGGAAFARHMQNRGARTIETLLGKSGSGNENESPRVPAPATLTLADLVARNQNPALDRLLKNKLSADDYQRVLPLRGAAALRELIQLRASDTLDERLKNKTADDLEQLVTNHGGKTLETLLTRRDLLDTLATQDGADTIRAVFTKDAGNDSLFALRRARGTDAYETLVLALRPNPLDHMLAMRNGGPQLGLLLAADGDPLAKFRALRNTAAGNILADMMAGDPVTRLYELIAAASADTNGDPAQTVQRLAAQGIADPSTILTNYGAALLQAGRRDDAIRAYQHALTVRPIPDAMANYAIILTQSGRGKEAVPTFEKLLQVETYARNPVILTNAGIAYSMAGKRDEAIRLLERALEINPDMSDARRNLEIIKQAKDAAR